MALSDWTQQQEASEIGTDTNHVYSGSSALRIESGSQPPNSFPYLTNDASATASPSGSSSTSIGVRTKFYAEVERKLVTVFRHQDTSNYYWAEFNMSGGATLGKVETGSGDALSGDGNIGGAGRNQWNELTWYAWENSDGDFTVQVEVDNGDDGSIDRTSMRLTHDGGNLWSGGGALGIGSGSGMVWYDETQLYY